jgi:hypothetical protein
MQQRPANDKTFQIQRRRTSVRAAVREPQQAANRARHAPRRAKAISRPRPAPRRHHAPAAKIMNRDEIKVVALFASLMMSMGLAVATRGIAPV